MGKLYYGVERAFGDRAGHAYLQPLRGCFCSQYFVTKEPRSSHSYVKVPGWDCRLRPPHPTLTNFEKNQVFDLRPDLARSWVRPGDWRPQNAILSTFWCIIFLLI